VFSQTHLDVLLSFDQKTGEHCYIQMPVECGLAKLPGGLMIYLQAIADVNHMGMGQFTLYNRSLIESIRISSIEKFVSPLFLFVCR
jgi:hypothetical protein